MQMLLIILMLLSLEIVKMILSLELSQAKMQVLKTDRTGLWSGGGTAVDVIVDQMTDADAAIAAFNPGGTLITGIRTIVFSIGNVEVLRFTSTADFTSINDQGGNPRDIRFEGVGITATGATVQTTFNWATITGLDSNGDPVAGATFTAPSVQYFWAVPRTNVMFSPAFTGTYASVANSIFSFTAISDEWIAVGGSATTVNIGGGGGDVNSVYTKMICTYRNWR